MAWIPSHQELVRHPKVNELMATLDISRPMTIGYLHLLWLWAVDYAPDGDLSRFKPAAISNACEWPGDPAEFIDGLKDVGFIDPDDTLHDWADYGGKYLAQREASRQRARTVREQYTQHTQTVLTREDKKRGDKRTEDKKRDEVGTEVPDEGNPISISLEGWKQSVSEAPSKQKKIQILMAMVQQTWGKHLEADAGDMMAGLLNHVKNDGARAASLLWKAIASDPQGSVIRMAMRYAQEKPSPNGARVLYAEPTMLQRAADDPSYAQMILEEVDAGDRELATSAVDRLRTIIEKSETKN